MSYKQISPIPVTEGGTGLVTSTTAYAPICGGTTATGAFQAASTGLATSGFVLTSNGAAALPSFQALPSSGITTINGDSGSVTGSTITLTGGTSGAVFTGSGSTMTESFNYLSLPSTTSTDGQIKINSNRFMHAYGTSNTFLGESAGNFTLTGTGNTALGYQTFINATSGSDNVAIGLLSMSGSVSGAYNVGVGRLALQSVTSGAGNVGIGTAAGKSITTSSSNVAIGIGAMELSSGSSNVALGQDAMQTAGACSNNVAVGRRSLWSLGTGILNACLGDEAGVSATGASSSNIYLNSAGAAESNTFRVARGTGTGNYEINRVFINGIYSITAAGSTSLVPVVDSNGQLATALTGSATIGLSTDSGTVTGSLFTGAGNKTVTLGSTSGTSTTTIQGGSGGIQLSGTFVNLPTTTSTVGQVRINNNRFMHAYGTNNTWLGTNAGNFTTTNTGENVGIGGSALVGISTGTRNTAVGFGAMGTNTIASSPGENTAVGWAALNKLSSGTGNTAVGANVLTNATTVSGNIAIGREVLTGITTSGNDNICMGYNTALAITTGGSNILIGRSAGQGSISTGQLNTGIGTYCFYDGGLTSGSYNIGIGFDGGRTLTTSDSHNVCINNSGTAGVSNRLAIGAGTGTGARQLNSAFIHGIYGITAVGTTLSVPMIDSNGQIATASSNSSTIGLSTDATSSTINLATGGAVKTVTLGSTNSTSATTVQSGSGALNITSTNGALTINSGTGALSISSDASATTVNVATGGAVKTATFGSTNSTSITTIQAGTGGLFTAGVRGVTTAVNDAIAVLVDSAGQLGTVSSSIRYKENVSDMGDLSSNIYDLRPVTFDFIGKPSHKKQVGLIAEEVLEVMPSLVAFNMDGEVESVKYHELPVLLLNEIKKLKLEIEELKARIK